VPAQERPESPPVPPEPAKLPDVGDAGLQTTLPKAKAEEAPAKGRVKSAAADAKETKSARVKAKWPKAQRPEAQRKSRPIEA